MIKHVVKNFPSIPRFRFWPYTQKRKRRIRGKFYKIFANSFINIYGLNIDA